MKVNIIGYAISVIAVLPFFVGGVLNLLKNPTAVKNLQEVDYPESLFRPFGVSVIAIGFLTLIPVTSFFGVILATGWMGGAMAAHVRIHDRYVVQAILPILIWLGFGLRHRDEMHRLFGF